MTWADKDTEALRGQDGSCEACVGNPTVTECTCIGGRAADEIERLQARVAELEANNEALQSHVAMRTEILAMAERADTIPRATLVRALRERHSARTCMDPAECEAEKAECLRLAAKLEQSPADVDAVLAPVREALSQLANRAASAAAEADKYRGAGATAFDLARAAVEEGERGAYAHSHCMVHNALAEAEKTGRGE